MDENTQTKVSQLVNESEIIQVVNSYFRALDEKNFASKHFATILTADATMTRPNGVVTAELKQAAGKWKISRLANNVVWRDGNGAKLQELFKNMAKSN